MCLGTILPKSDPMVMHWYECLIEAFGDNEEYQLILNAGELSNQPKNCFSAERIPQLHALKHSDVFIHHGGMNSLNEGVHFKVPMIAIPHSHDQFINAARMVETGKGIVIRKDQITAKLLREKVLELLGNEYEST